MDRNPISGINVRRAAETRPLLGRRNRRACAGRLLLVCWYDPHGITTVYENIAMWQRLSIFELEILNLWPSRDGPLALPATVDLSEYDGVIIHAAVSYSFANLSALDSKLIRPFEHYDGIKVLMKQDEQRTTALFAEYLGRKKFDVLLTCVPERELPRVYQREEVGDVAFVQVLTGYVSPAMQEMATPWSRARPIDLGYRGSLQPLSFGRLGFEKRKIGYDVGAALAGRTDIKIDISSKPRDRFAGSAWTAFMAASKATLGVESGSNLFDFDGKVEEWCQEFEASHPETDRLSEEFYRLADAEYLCQFEGNVDYAQISPRHFEAAAARSLQILYDGRYSDVFVGGKHFLPLARDLSNLDDVLETLDDERRCIEITERCFAEIIQNQRYGYEAFVSKVDQALEAALERKGGRQRSAVARESGLPRCLVLSATDPAQGRRIGWLGNSFARDHEVYEIGTYKSGIDGAGPTLERVSDRQLRIRIERTRHGSWWIPQPISVGRTLSLGWQKLLYLGVLVEASEPQLRSSIGALDAMPEDVAQFRARARRIIDSSSALYEAARRTGRFDLVAVTDLDSLPAGVALCDETGALLFVDLRELIPEKTAAARHWQSEFWTDFGHELVGRAEFTVTASPQLALLMAAEHGRKFEVLPDPVSLTETADDDFEKWEIAFEPFRGQVLEAERARSQRDDDGTIDLAWVDDPHTMRDRSPTESETTRCLKTYANDIIRLHRDHPIEAELETARVLGLYAAEIIRLNEYFPAEISRLNEVYPAEIARLQAEIERLHQVYKAEIGGLHTEIDRLRRIIERYWTVRAYRLWKKAEANLLRTLHKAGATGS